MKKFDFPKQRYLVEAGTLGEDWSAEYFTSKTAAIRYAKLMKASYKCVSVSSMGVIHYL